MPRRSRRLNLPHLLDGLSDDLVLLLFSRVPFVTHGTLHVVCRRLKTLLRSREFRQQRVDSGLAEYGLVVAGGYANGEATADCSMLTKARWFPPALSARHLRGAAMAPLSHPRAFAYSAVVEDEDGQPELWVMGGENRRPYAIYLWTVEAYNPRTNTWRSCLPLSQPRAGAIAGVVGGRLVIAGGCAPFAPLTSVEAYTPTGWAPLPPLPHAANGATACVLRGQLYVMGGWDSNKLQVLAMSEENQFSWTVKAELPAARRGAASVAHEGKIWLIGGYVTTGFSEGRAIWDIADDDNSASVVIYDIGSDSWDTGPALPRASLVAHPNPFVRNGEICVIAHDSVWVCRNGTWMGAAGMPGGHGMPYLAVEYLRLG